MTELSEVCSVLSRHRKTDPGAPTDLASRLESIAGESAEQPLYLSAGASSAGAALPSPRRARQRLVVQSGVAVLTIVVAVMVLAVAIAPSPPVVSQPVETAHDQFNLALAAIGSTESIGAVLFAHERGAQFAQSSTERAVEVVQEQALRISADDAAKLIAAAFDPGLNYSGRQRVAVAHGGGEFLTAEVQLDKVEGEGTSMVVLDATGDRFVSTIHPELSHTGMAPPSSWSFYQYPTVATIAGRGATVVEARVEDHVAARWWMDVPTGVLLRAERFDSDGDPALMVGFESISYESAQLPDDAQQLIALMPASASGVTGWCRGAASCAGTLAGLPLVAYSSGDEEDASSMLLVYSDGFQTVTVSWSHGILADDAPSGLQLAKGQASVLAWQAGESVVLVASNGSSELLEQAASELPGESPYPDSWQHWVRRGLSRIW
ncbi:hypothetical protein [Tessaracoccus caeni]|uniref:hypothetical protein n=1 Tax=Tessaracoccus caeni TaxID=3031239 RepID=UPI0023DA42E5|nr:hypothetical protein [Tessaracoccus caeni]MDF1487661.1 hypothetical protein [Tessaracoccus caeni]